VPRISATSTDLPAAVASALGDPLDGVSGVVSIGQSWPTLSWGRLGDPPILLVHGVTSNAGIWWRVGPALAAAGYRVTALDMPGHGMSPRRDHWSIRFVDTAAELAMFIRAAGLDVPGLAVVGHSWGAMVSAHLPAAGLAPAKLVLLDPPYLTLGRLRALTESPTERDYATLEAAEAAVRRENPAWSDGDVEAKARALTQFHPELVLSVLLQNGDWDAGMSALRDPAAARSETWLIRGDWATGGFIPDSRVPRIEAQLGADRVITIADAPHSPQRTHPEATVLAILRALGH
jgi:pimeloyl-ACP methyl ester carboxylesterase